jgi:1,3-beta-glucan synthase
MKQSKLRRKRVFRYAALYFIMLVVFVALIVGPIVAGKQIPDSAFNALKDYHLVQPINQNNDDTIQSGETGAETGTGSPSYTGAGTKTRKSTSEAATSTTVEAKIRLF